VTTPALERRLAELIIDGHDFTADDVTSDGSVTVAGDHGPNAKQNAIGSMFNTASRKRRIEWTGGLVRSSAPHRKGGAIRVWRGTSAGRRWAELLLERT
jgi:hypothetical protein